MKQLSNTDAPLVKKAPCAPDSRHDVLKDKPYYIVPPCHEPVLTLFEDASIVIVEKPAFLLSVPGRGPENSDSVLSRLRQQNPDILLLHRLDLDTSGLMVFAKTRQAQKHIARAFQQRAIGKRYVAVVEGLMEADDGSIDLPIAPDWQNRPRQKISAEKGKQALTHWHRLESYLDKGTSRLELHPITGRSHQLRIHLKEAGHPILGCDLYAPPAIEAKSPRLLLHACQLSLHHPLTDEWLTFVSPPPF